MKIKIAAACFLAGALALPVVGHTGDYDTDRDSPKAFVKDSIITTKIKAKLAEERITSAVQIKVDTDNKGVVTLSGTAKTQEEATRRFQSRAPPKALPRSRATLKSPPANSLAAQR